MDAIEVYLPEVLNMYYCWNLRNVGNWARVNRKLIKIDPERRSEDSIGLQYRL